MNELKLRQRISPGTDFLMKFTAAGFDFIGLLLFITGIGGTIVGIIGDLTFFVWYITKGIRLWKGKSFNKTAVNFVAELIPILNDFYPGFSIFVWTNNKQIKKEDDEYNEKIKDEYEKQQIQIKALAEQTEYMRQTKMIEELNNAEANALAKNIDSERNNNEIGKLLSLGGGLPTKNDSVYRSVANYGAIKDLMDHGSVRNAQSAGVTDKSRWGERVFWSKGEDGKNHALNEGYIIEAPHSIASQRNVRREDVTAIHTRDSSGKPLDILPHIKNSGSAGGKING